MFDKEISTPSQEGDSEAAPNEEAADASLAPYLLGAAAFTLSACGGGGGGGGSSPSGGVLSPPAPLPPPPMTATGAARLLTQTSFGPTLSEINAATGRTILDWLELQFNTPSIDTHWGYVSRKGPPGCTTCDSEYINAFMESFWYQAIKGNDQLRQRLVFALTEIFVISTENSPIGGDPFAFAGYLDMLGKHVFGNFRDLLEGVAMSPAMGYYLSHIQNEKEDPSTGRIPDENFAREVMQLFTIGLWELNGDGSRKLDLLGKPVPTYGQADISGMAKVFTGFSWGGPDTDENRWYGWPINEVDSVRWDLPMQSYQSHASTSEKRIVGGVVIPAGTSGTQSLKIALDTLFNHPNVGPFIGSQLIKRLVTSNPSKAYVQRVTNAFNNNGSGVRGDMKAVFRAIYTDPETDAAVTAGSNSYGKLKEPVLCLAQWLRAFDAKAPKGLYAIWNLEDPVWSLGQNPLRAPSVFNWYRPEYTPPGAIAAAGLVAPEFQQAHETTVTAYVNFITGLVEWGVGWEDTRVSSAYTEELKLAPTPSALIDHLDRLLCFGTLTPETKTIILDALNSLDATETDYLMLRVICAVTLVMLSAEFRVQK